MNIPLKVLAGIALVMVILASGVFILKNVSPSRIDGGGGKVEAEPTTSQQTAKAPPGEPEVVSKGPPPVLIKEPIQVPPDHPLQPHYKPINQPEWLQQLRQEGKTYHSRVVGKVTGRASKKDWGIRGVAYFEYLYAVESRGKIVKNDGVTIIEERYFGKVHEDLLVSGYEIVVELPDKLDTVFNFLDRFGPQARAVSEGGRDLKEIVNHVRVPIKKEWVDQARQQGLFSKAPDLDPQKMESELKMFTQGTDNKLLEGKTVRITFKDAAGVTGIEGVGCAISRQEEDVIVRTNLLMDHYIFPDQKTEPGKDWPVDGSVFAGFLDPRLQGKVGGKVIVLRTPDFVDAQGEVSKKLKIVDGELTVTDETGKQNITGHVTGLRGVCAIPDSVKVVTTAFLHGYAEYKALSRDHLLFEAETTVTPKIQISYECTVE